MFVPRVLGWLSAIDIFPRRRFGLLYVALVFVVLGFGGCAQRPQTITVSHGKEYFPSSIYGPASPRVIADGQPVPRGGGQYLVGKPYMIAGHTYYPSESRRTQIGNASWYGDAFHGRRTANGEIYDRDAFTAASPTMPLPSYARVTNLRNNYSMVVRVNDRGPYASDRIMDVSRRVAEALDYKRHGTTRVKVEYVGRASLAGSDDGRLLATLRTNRPAPWQSSDPTMVAEAEPQTRVASIAPYGPSPSRHRDVEPGERGGRYADDDRPTRHVVPPDSAKEYRDRRPLGSREPGRATMRGYDPANRSRAMSQPRFAGPGYRHDRDVESPRRHEPRARDFMPEPHQTRMSREPAHTTVLPPSRPIDLATIPGAASPIRARHTTSHLRMARARGE